MKRHSAYVPPTKNQVVKGDTIDKTKPEKTVPVVDEKETEPETAPEANPANTKQEKNEPATPAQKTTPKTENTTTGQNEAAAAADTTVTNVKRVNVKGYRIQLFSGDDSRAARTKAYNMAARFKELYPRVPVYTHFYSPHWTCRVGEFRNLNDAQRFLNIVRKTGDFPEAVIIRQTIQVREK